MRRAFLATYGACLVALLLAGVLHREHRAFTLGVTPLFVGAQLPPDSSVCQAAIRVPRSADFDTVRLLLGTYGRPGPALSVVVRDATAFRAVLGRGRVPAGYPDNGAQDVRTGPVAAGSTIEVCVRNTGARKVALYGGGAGISPSDARVAPGGAVLPADLSLVFLRSKGRPLLALVPAVLHRASLWHGGLTPTWLLWLLLVLVVVGVPALLARAMPRDDRLQRDGDDEVAAVAASRAEPPTEETATLWRERA